MVELAQRVPDRSPPWKSTSTASAFAILRTLSVKVLISSREYMARNYIGTDRAGKKAGGAMANIEANTQLERMTSGVPKVIDAKGHAVLDYMTAGTFLAAGFALRNRNRAASTWAFVNGLGVLGASMMTDYPGGVWKLFSFKTHRMIDVGQAAMAAAGPALFGFAGEPEGQFFHGQAALETGVIAMTNWGSAAR